ncbi:Lon family ATP-dependent protease [Clostridium cellulovorans]|uniref:endopeptidase La n=1 Tax=Clostridium cellulovorans (strain ATCC 35296 / DSM 3052 / OCM 3 / 743B) TaxID=573061 RepID=D9SPB5_CLOC7|nr:Lon family ATP-dependent protease [Clostridium cellulovorans]ADL54017.1 Sigma 54 interacting domain protein [Clostridium cellulovorans 743B]
MNSNTNSFKIDNDEIRATISIEVQVKVMYDAAKKVIDEGIFRSRVVKYKLQKYINSENIYERVYALNKVVSNGKGLKEIPNEKNLLLAIEETSRYLSEEVARRYVQNNIEKDVEQLLIERQEKYMDEVRMGIIKKKKGPENARTLKKYADLETLDTKSLSKDVLSILRPQSFDEIVGQERAIKALISKIATPYPQNIILYGPPGVGKTTAARLALEECKKLKFTPFEEDSKFIEVDGTTLRWDPREITNPLLGSVHDPIYQGSRRDLAETGIPEPKPGLVTDAHGGVLFIDEIGELDQTLQNKLLKVLEDKRVEFSSSYYDPDDDTVPAYIKYLFDKGAPADFVLIGATTRSPGEMSPALRSRCTAVYFEPLNKAHIENIVENAAERLKVTLDDGVAELISRYTIEGRKAVNILADAYGNALYNNDDKEEVEITLENVKEVISIGRMVPYEKNESMEQKEVGEINGLGVSGYMGSALKIEATTFEAKKEGTGSIRFNDTAGSMAKDSVFNAAAVIRKVTDIDIKNYDIHVNVVGGGNIDGPSAGAAITVCIISALLNKPLRQDIAITGEISLKGKVKPVGGIFEKIYGARRKGIKTVIVPKDNEKEIPTGLDDIEVLTVSTIEELMELVF